MLTEILREILIILVHVLYKCLNYHTPLNILPWFNIFLRETAHTHQIMHSVNAINSVIVFTVILKVL